MKKISFIISAYNAEKTIEKCVDSILNQKKVDDIDFEIIVVNDGSNDNTKLVKEKYKDKIKYFEKENGGCSLARNFGVKKATGDYYIFIDSDDYIKNTLIKDIEKYINEDFDLIKWNPIFVDENGKALKKNRPYDKDIIVKGEDGFNLLYGKDYLMDCSWNYCIKKDNFVEFPKESYHEDFATTPLVMVKLNKMAITKNYEYYYVQTKESIMRGNDEKKQEKRVKDLLKHYDNNIKVSEKLDLKKETKENMKIFCTYSVLSIENELTDKNKRFLKQELRKRKIYKNIKVRNLKSLLKKIYFYFKY